MPDNHAPEKLLTSYCKFCNFIHLGTNKLSFCGSCGRHMQRILYIKQKEISNSNSNSNSNSYSESNAQSVNKT